MSNLIVTTSGTTGEPKTMEISPALMDKRQAALAGTRGDGFTRLKSLFVASRTTSPSFLRYKAWAAANGVEFFGPQPTMDAVVEMVLKNKPEGIVGSPGFLLNLGKRLKGQHTFSHIHSGGHAMLPWQAKRIRSTLGKILFSAYSTSETNTIALANGDDLERKPTKNPRATCLGRLCKGVEVKISDGEIIAKTPTMITSYTDADQSAKSFWDGWFCTGDLGHFEDDVLYFDGRKRS